MSEIDRICSTYNVINPALIIEQRVAFWFEFEEKDLIAQLDKIDLIPDRIIYLEELSNLSNSKGWESDLIEPEVAKINELANQHLLNNKKLLYEENTRLYLNKPTNRNSKFSDTDSDSRDYNLPNPLAIAETYYEEINSRNRPYEAEVIAKVMQETKNYLEKNPGLKTIHGHIKTITETCKNLKGGRDAKKNWIKHYAEKTGLRIR